MPSAGSFFGLYVQRDAIQIAQKALDITGHNISNINTPGYTRQRVDICSVSNSTDTVGYRTSVALAGKGSDVVGVAQVRDRTRDKLVRAYSGDLCNVGVKTNTLSDIEDVFDSIEADSGYVEASFAAIVNKLEAALQSFSSENADRAEIANTTMNAAQSLVQSINNSNGKLDDIAASVFEDANKTVVKINSILSQMGKLNEQIMDAYVSMGYTQRNMNNYEVMGDYGPLELKDEMNSLIDELAQYGNVKFAEEDDGSFTIHFADQLVVYQKKYAQMAITEDHPRPTELSYVITHGYTGKNELGETVVYGDLYDKDEWYALNVKNDTGGDVQYLIRNFSDQLQKDLKNVTGKRPDGSYYLDKGTLRGYLDVYNGRGLYTDDANGTPDDGDIYKSFQTIRKQLDLANEALKVLQNPDGKTDGELRQAETDLLNSVNARVTREEDGTYTVTVNNKTILNKGEDLKTLDYEPDTDAFDRPTGDVTITADGDYVRSITVNSYTGIEYYRDMLNCFAKTIHDEFNGVYTDVEVKINKADYVNKLAAQLTAYNKDPAASRLTEEDIQEILDALSPKDPDGNTLELATVTKIEKDGFTVYEIAADGKTVLDKDGNLDRLNTENSEEATIVKSYKLFEYDTDFFRNASGNIRVSDDWINDPTIVSNPTRNNKYEELDNVYINKLLGVLASDHQFLDDFGRGREGEKGFNIEGFVSHLCDNLGSKVDEEMSVYKTTDIMLTMEEEARSEVMDVAMNEEGINMMNYQKWYNAIARMITTLDEALEKLINGTGIVGLR